MKMNNPGMLNKLITVGHTECMFDDETGRDKGITFVSDFVLHANVKHVKGSEYFAASAVNAQNTIQFMIRYCDKITQNTIIKYANKYYDVKSVNDVEEAHDCMVIMAEEIENGSF